MDPIDWFVIGVMGVISISSICKMVSSDMKEIDSIYQEHQRIKSHSEKNGIHIDRGFDTMSEYIEYLEILSQQKEEKERGIELARRDMEKAKAEQFVMHEQYLTEQEEFNMIKAHYQATGGRMRGRESSSDIIIDVDLTVGKGDSFDSLVIHDPRKPFGAPPVSRIRLSSHSSRVLLTGTTKEKAHVLKQFVIAMHIPLEYFLFDDSQLNYFAEETTFYYDSEAPKEAPVVTAVYNNTAHYFPSYWGRNMIYLQLKSRFPEVDFTKVKYNRTTHTYYLHDKVEYDSVTRSYDKPMARVKNNPLTNQAVYNLIQEFRQYPLTAVERSLYAAEVDNIKEGSRTIDQSIIIDNLRKKYSTEIEDDRSNEDMAMMNYDSAGMRPTSYDKKEEEPSMSLYPLPKTEELTLKEKLKQHDTYNGYYPNIKKVDLTQPIKFKKISLVINRYLTIPISEVAKDCLIGGDQYYLECLLAVYRMEKDNKYKIPSYINVKNLRFFYEESRILCVDEDDLDTRVVKVKVQGSTISLPSASTRRSIVESISILYPYVDLTKAYYDSDTHLYDFDSTNLILESKKKLSGEELNSAFKHIYGDAVEAVSESVQVVSSSKFADNIKADVINANAFAAHEYPLRFPKGEDNKKFEWPKEVVAREWFFGIEETEEELKARYKIQEKNMVGWDDF